MDEPAPRAPRTKDRETRSASMPRTRDDRVPLVDIVVPVYGNRDLTLRCLNSVLEARPATPYRLVVIDDCSPDIALRNALARLAADHMFLFRQNSTNLGFPATCNIGFALSTSTDVVILNSDTEVFNDWLDRLRDVAYSIPRVATVTPLTNSGTICSYPEFLTDNAGPFEIPDASIDLLTARTNAHIGIKAPTGVGFCMYIRRAALIAFTGFDATAFGRGYGEENDFCQRAVASGWSNLLAPGVFVRHHGGASFGDSKANRVADAVDKVEQRHPGYRLSVQNFIEADPLHDARAALDYARISRRTEGRAILMISHSWGGGTERHVQELRCMLEESGVPVLEGRVEGGRHVRITDPGTPRTPNLGTIDVRGDPNALAEFFRRTGIGHVHIHHLAGYAEETADFIRLGAAGAGVAYDVTAHDFMAFCPRIHLVGGTGVYCGEPSSIVCQDCLDTMGSPFGSPIIWAWRERFSRLLFGARRVFAPSEDTARRLRAHFRGLHVHVRPHPEAPPDSQGGQHTPPSIPARQHGTRRIAVIGAIGPHKGSALLAATAGAAAQARLPLEFVIIGYTDRDQQLQKIGNVHITGEYAEGDLKKLLTTASPDAIWFPAVWPETYSYTLSAVLQTSAPCVAFDLGAIAERLKESGSNRILLPLSSMLRPEQLAHFLSECRLPSHRHEISSERSYADPLHNYYGFLGE